MTDMGRTVLLVLLLTVIAAGTGGWLGVHYGLSHARSPVSLNRLLHRQLHLSTGQSQRLAAMEAAYLAQRKTLEGEELEADRELAAALLSDHQYGPRAERAIDHFSTAMKALQVATVVHVMAMRAVLTPKQAEKFDQAVTQALDSGRP